MPAANATRFWAIRPFSQHALPLARTRPATVSVYLNEGLRIATILLAWAVVAAVFTFGVSQIGTTGSLFASVGPGLGLLFAVTGVLNAVLYVSLRSIDYWQTA